MSNKSPEGAKQMAQSPQTASSQQLAALLKRRGSEEKKDYPPSIQTGRSGLETSKDFLDTKTHSPKVMSTQKLTDLQEGSGPLMQSQMFQPKGLMQPGTARNTSNVNSSTQQLPGIMPRSPEKHIIYSTQSGAAATKSRNALQTSTSAGSSGIKYKSSTKPNPISTGGIMYSSSPKIAST